MGASPVGAFGAACSCTVLVAALSEYMARAAATPLPPAANEAACLHILDANGGQKYVLAEMSNRCNSSLSGGAGPNYGVLQPPSLVQ